MKFEKFLKGNMSKEGVLDIYLTTCNFKEEFYMFKKKLRMLYKRNQIINGYAIGVYKGELHIWFHDLINCGGLLGMFLTKKNTIEYSGVFGEILEDSQRVCFFYEEEGKIFTTITKNRKLLTENFLECTGYELNDTLVKYNEYYKKL